jgi:hypothetical protein
MRTFQEFISLCEATYDPEVHGRSQITGPVVPGGRIGRDRRLPPSQIRRTRWVDGKMVPVRYKEREDTGIQRPTKTRVQQPEQERGSPVVINAFAAATKAKRREAALARREAAKSGEPAPTVQQPRTDLEKQATVLLSKRKPETVSPDYKPQKPSGLSRKKRRELTRKGERELRDLVLKSTGKTSEKDLKHRYTSK